MTYVAFLRAINVGGHAVVKMTDLKFAFDVTGAKNVQTYIQSGNVIFDAPDNETSRAKLFQNIQVALNKLLGKHVDIIYRSRADLQQAITDAPFGDIAEREDVKLYVVFLMGPPAKLPKLPMVFEKDGIEIPKIVGADVYLISRPVGKGRYGVPNLRVEKDLDVIGTARNWNTVNKIMAKMG